MLSNMVSFGPVVCFCVTRTEKACFAVGHQNWVCHLSFSGGLKGSKNVLRSTPDFTEARDSEWQWNLRGHMQAAPRSTQITTAQFFTGRMPFLRPNQHCQSTEGKTWDFMTPATVKAQLPLSGAFIFRPLQSSTSIFRKDSKIITIIIIDIFKVA